MLRIYDEMEWRRRRRVLLLTMFAAGSLFGALMANSAPAGSDDLGQRPALSKPARADAGCDSQPGLRLACSLETAPR
ncbi:MAG: hypothetical protein Q8Q73_08810 [Stagnimonas sp.]|nr:hypothetical protein [Stagnimonas sp.]